MHHLALAVNTCLLVTEFQTPYTWPLGCLVGASHWVLSATAPSGKLTKVNKIQKPYLYMKFYIHNNETSWPAYNKSSMNFKYSYSCDNVNMFIVYVQYSICICIFLCRECICSQPWVIWAQYLCYDVRWNWSTSDGRFLIISTSPRLNPTTEGCTVHRQIRFHRSGLRTSGGNNCRIMLWHSLISLLSLYSVDNSQHPNCTI